MLVLLGSCQRGQERTRLGRKPSVEATVVAEDRGGCERQETAVGHVQSGHRANRIFQRLSHGISCGKAGSEVSGLSS